MAFVEAPQTMEEVAAVPRLVNGPCLLNVVWRGKTPELTFGEAERMGYRLAIVPGLLFKAALGICDAVLSELPSTDRHPVPVDSLTIREAFRRVGADEWDAVSDRFAVVKPASVEGWRALQRCSTRSGRLMPSWSAQMVSYCCISIATSSTTVRETPSAC
jgi:hypothetical protein